MDFLSVDKPNSIYESKLQCNKTLWPSRLKASLIFDHAYHSLVDDSLESISCCCCRFLSVHCLTFDVTVHSIHSIRFLHFSDFLDSVCFPSNNRDKLHSFRRLCPK